MYNNKQHVHEIIIDSIVVSWSKRSESYTTCKPVLGGDRPSWGSMARVGSLELTRTVESKEVRFCRSHLIRASKTQPKSITSGVTPPLVQQSRVQKLPSTEEH